MASSILPGEQFMYCLQYRESGGWEQFLGPLFHVPGFKQFVLAGEDFRICPPERTAAKTAYDLISQKNTHIERQFYLGTVRRTSAAFSRNVSVSYHDIAWLPPCGSDKMQATELLRNLRLLCWLHICSFQLLWLMFRDSASCQLSFMFTLPNINTFNLQETLRSHYLPKLPAIIFSP